MGKREASEISYLKIKNTEDYCGFILGADYCAEHENGINPLLFSYGVVLTENEIKNQNKEKNAWKKYKIKKYNENTFFSFYKKEFAIIGSTTEFEQKELLELLYEKRSKKVRDYKECCSSNKLYEKRSKGKKDYKDYCLPNPNSSYGSWDRKEFLIATIEPSKIKLLKQMEEAFKRCDIAMYLHHVDNPFARGGLVIVSVSKTPDNLDDVEII